MTDQEKIWIVLCAFWKIFTGVILPVCILMAVALIWFAVASNKYDKDQ
jgi:hypothetical protein